MSTISTLFILGISLSMDTFSISLSIGTFQISSKKILFFSILVGIMHFIFPLIGVFLGNKVINYLKIDINNLLGVILLFICLEIIIDLIKKEDKVISLNIINLLLLAVTVSLDSFSTGLCLNALTTNYILASTIFCISSISFTILGLIIGKYSNKKLGKYANLLGFILLFIIGIYHLFL